MNNKLFAIMLSCLIISSVPQHLLALGIGAYGDAGIKSTYWDEGEEGGTGYVKYINSLDYFYGGGIVLDTAVARDTLFGYRIKIGYSQYNVTKKENAQIYSKDKYHMHRFNMGNTFGFGVVRNETVRFWLGPRINFNYLYYSYSCWDRTLYMPFMFDPSYENTIPYREKLVERLFTFELSLAMGININFKNDITLFIDTDFGGNVSTGRRKFKYGMESLSGLYFSKMFNLGYGGNISLGLMYRINDNYTEIVSL